MTRYKCPNCQRWVKPLYLRDYEGREKNGLFKRSNYGLCETCGVVEIKILTPEDLELERRIEAKRKYIYEASKPSR